MIYPLGPTKLLAMVRPDVAGAWGIETHTDRVYLDQLDSIEVLEITHEPIAHSTRFVVERPTRQLGLQLQVGTLPGAAQFEEVAPVREGNREGSLMRFFKRNPLAGLPLHGSLPGPWLGGGSQPHGEQSVMFTLTTVRVRGPADAEL